MASRDMITLTVVLLFFILGILSPTRVACSRSSKSCCTGYTKKPVPFECIVGFRVQSIKENCRIHAIIFYTIKKKEICTNPEDEWVRKTLEKLSAKLKKMSKSGSANGETPVKKSGKPSVHDGSGYFFNTTEPFLNDTEIFY